MQSQAVLHYTGRVFTASYTFFENCHTSFTNFVIMAHCVKSNSSATGFQMIVQLGNPDKAHKLYINSTTESPFQVTITVEESGMYHITIFAIRGQEGIVNSNAEYSMGMLIEEITNNPTTVATAYGI